GVRLCLSCCFFFWFFFFFQAEDGIRDGHVTGVQTCALPISGSATRLFSRPRPAGAGVVCASCGGARTSPRPSTPASRRRGRRSRSEERRVGKECGAGWSASQ